MSSVSPVISAADLLTARAAGAEIVVLEVRRDRTDLPAGAALTDPAPAGHLPGAHAADFTDFVGARTRDSGNGPLPSHDQVADLVRRWGIHDGSLVVVYSPDAPSSATRAWWVLRWAGLADVRYLDGGVAAWVSAGGELTDTRPAEGGGTARISLGALPTLDAESAAALARSGHLLDARGSAAYAGSADDPTSGHIPGAHSLPGSANLREAYLLDESALRERYASHLDGEVGSYCGGGVAATVNVLALATIGVRASLYPGSWSQWVTDPDRPVAQGAERG
ncbi:sulfurtransferase [Nocardia takedensis]|uniref:sulfurtransferase n=1 Tax=Nocardia takedensis TaxID=259390 RepID=UPI00031F5D1B|nr:rhodanese-like domain-containing protein [Nocardia takedensis]